MFKKLTVCGRYSVAIVGKSCQCHIKVWDYLRKYDRSECPFKLNYERRYHLDRPINRLYIFEDLDNAVYAPLIWKMSAGNSNEEQIFTEKKRRYLQSTCTCALHCTDCFLYSAAFSHYHCVSGQFWDLCREQHSCNYNFIQFICFVFPHNFIEEISRCLQ